jgi:hypothetical protein
VLGTRTVELENQKGGNRRKDKNDTVDLQTAGSHLERGGLDRLVINLTD